MLFFCKSLLIGEKIIADRRFTVDIARRAILSGDGFESGALNKKIPILGGNGVVHNFLEFALVN